MIYPHLASVVGATNLVHTTHGQRHYANLDNAASTPPFAYVLKLLQALAPWYASIHRGTGFKSRFSTDVYEQARLTALRFVGADPDEHTAVFTKNTTEAINKAAAISSRKVAERLPIIIAMRCFVMNVATLDTSITFDLP